MQARLFIWNSRFCANAAGRACYCQPMTTDLTLYYAPDNASLCVRLALLAVRRPFQTVLVDRSVDGQSQPAYLAKNPNGQIPTLETPDGAIYETGAILLWLADQHAGQLFPAPDAPARAEGLKWLFWLSNTLHPALRMMFYPEKYIDADTIPALQSALRAQLTRQMAHLEAHAPWLDETDVSILGTYLAPMLRWSALYGAGPRWFEIAHFQRLHAFALRMERRDISDQASRSEGLGQTIFSAPSLPNPPEGSAL